MNIHEYQKYDAVGLAGLLRDGEVTSAELMQCAIDLAKTRGAELNAICYENYEGSLDVAREWKARGSFGGIPFLLKNSSLASRRFDANVGSRLFQDLHFSYDSTLVARFGDAGLIAFARTTTPEFCMAPTTEAAINGGPTLNPWDRTRSPGGSSGGAAAAIAARVVPLAHGSDGGGSIRIPASCCGLFGLKPSRGLVPVGPTKGEIWGGLGTDGVLSISVRDTAAAMDAIAGREEGAPYASPHIGGSFKDAAALEEIRPLRIVAWDQAWNDEIEVAVECKAAVAHAAKLLESLGHHVEYKPIMQCDFQSFESARVVVMASNVAASVNARLAALGRPLGQDDLERAIRDGYEMGQSMTAEQYLCAINKFHEMGRMLESYMRGYDLVLTPTLTTLPVKLGYLSMAESFSALRAKASRYAAFLAISNAAGTPAVSLPLYTTESGLPVGVQLIGKLGDDAKLINLSAQLERIAPWAARLPQAYREKA